jgi:LacI family transcriptional regulator
MCQSFSITFSKALQSAPVKTSRVTIRDVAARAGVSVATVSKVLNDRYGVATSTVKRVRAVIADLGYESSLVARSLRNHRTNVIGVLVWDIEPYSAEVLKGASRAIKGTGYELVVYAAGGKGAERIGWEHRYLSRLSGTLIDGAVMVTPTVQTAPFAGPVVAVDPDAGAADLPTVASDDLRGAQLAVEHLLELGHRRIGLLGRPPRDLESGPQRADGYRSALLDAGITPDPELLRAGGYETGYEDAARHLLTLPDRPTAIFAVNDVSAITTMEVARSLGLCVPRDLSVIGFDNVPESAMTRPALTTVEQPIQLMGERAIEILLDLLAGHEPDQRQVRLPTRLVVRDTCAQPVVSPADGGGTR